MDEFKYCRACLVTDVKMFSLETKSPDSVGAFYSDLVQDQISDEDQHVCFECASLLYKFKEFKSKCLRAHYILSGVKLVSSEITRDTLENVDRKMNKLESTLKINPVVVFYEERKNYAKSNELNTIKDKGQNYSEINVKTEEEKYIVIEHYNNLGVDCKYEYNDDSTEVSYTDYIEESFSETAAQSKWKINHDEKQNTNKIKLVKNEYEDDYNLSDEMEESFPEIITQPKIKKRKVMNIKSEGNFYLSDDMSESVTEIAAQPTRRTKQPNIIKKRPVLKVMGEDDFKLLEEMEQSESVPESETQPLRRSIRNKQSNVNKSDSLNESVPKTAQSKQKSKQPRTNNIKVIKTEQEDVFIINDSMEESDTLLEERTTKQKSKQPKKPKSKVIKNENTDDSNFSDPGSEMEESDPESETNTTKKRKQTKRKRVTKDPNKNNSGPDYSFFDDYGTVEFMTTEEARKELLIRKQSKNYKTSALKCDICYTGFELKLTYEKHLERHTPENGDFKCDVCYLRFPQKVYLRKHKMFNHRKKFSCKLCPFVCYKTDRARNHVNMHQGLKYLCKHCGEEFSMQSTLRLHYRTKHIDETLTESVCQFCGDIFGTLKGLRSHTIRLHKQDKNDKLGPECGDCGVYFTSEMAWKRHLVLSSRHKVNIGCKFCGETFSKEDELKAHLKMHTRQSNTYNNTKVPAACPICETWLETREEYKDHVTTEHPSSAEAAKFLGAHEKPYVCEHCGHAFKNNGMLQDHQRKHTGERPFKCSECSKSFRTGNLLALHMQTHSGLRPHKCEICDRAFTFKCILARHMKIHLNIRPYTCTICDKKFINACDVKWHTIHVHDKVPRPKRKTEKRKIKRIENEKNE